jgi:hypothetical protein
MKEFKIGDKVVMKGEIKTINTAGEYIVGVEWRKGEYLKYYLSDGKVNHLDKQPTISHETKERVVQVRNTQKDAWVNRVFIMEKNGEFLCWHDAKTIEDSKRESTTTTWTFMREIPEKRVIKMQEIAEKFNIDVEQIEIEK